MLCQVLQSYSLLLNIDLTGAAMSCGKKLIVNIACGSSKALRHTRQPSLQPSLHIGCLCRQQMPAS